MPNSYVTNLYPKPTPGVADQTLTVDATAGGVQFGTAFNNITRYIVLDVQGADVRELMMIQLLQLQTVIFFLLGAHTLGANKQQQPLSLSETAE